MHYDFDQEVDRRASLSVKWNPSAIKNICGNPEAQPFWVADMDFTVADEVAQQARTLAEHAVFGYPFAPNQRQIFCGWAERRHNLMLSPKEVVISQGVLSSIAILTELLTKEGDGIIIPLPAYQPFVRIVNQLHRTLIPWPLAYDPVAHQFQLDWETLEECAQKAKLLVFCSPHNPSGLSFSKEDLTRLCTIAKAHQIPLISDEIHADLSFVDHHSLLETARETGADAVVCMAPSKTFNMAGEHYSVTLFTDEALRNAFKSRLGQLFIAENSTFAITLAQTCYQHGDLWLKDLLAYLQGNTQLIEEYLTEYLPSLVFIRPKASFIGLFDCSAILDLVERDEQAHPELYDPSQSPSGGLLSRFFGQRAGLAMNDGTWFGGDAYRNFVRFNYGTQRCHVREALDKIAQAVQFLEQTYAN
ncbi:MAG: MalY/PatB family protein [Sphaerochaeta sp.]|uniref:MalY/PatB family protein n=1 Tax=Sphaerochaeta sp. TaxID=1972642 RepID=UPI003D106210